MPLTISMFLFLPLAAVIGLALMIVPGYLIHILFSWNSHRHGHEVLRHHEPGETGGMEGHQWNSDEHDFYVPADFPPSAGTRAS
jgi:hypothetical protein